jgi:hypothetical protein
MQCFSFGGSLKIARVLMIISATDNSFGRAGASA